MRAVCHRVIACAGIVLLAGGVASAQQNRGSSKSRFDLAAAAGGVVTSVDADGTPQFVVATDSQPAPLAATHESAARWHLGRFARAHSVTPADVAEASPISVHELKSGDVIVAMRQRHAGLDVYGSDVKVLMHADHRLVAIAGHPVATAGAQARFGRSPQDALAAALSERFGAPVSTASIETVSSASGDQRFQIAAGSALHMSEAAPVKAVFFPVGGRLVAAYVTDFYAGTTDSADSAAFRYVIAADDGRVLERRDLTVSEAPHNPPSATPPTEFTYRVFAEPSNQRPLDGPQIGLTPHPTGVPDGIVPPLVPPNLVTVGGFNHPPSGVPDPWLPADAIETTGNNADAYVDLSAPDGFTAGVDFRADITSAHFFDRIYDFTQEPVASVDQQKASITNAFYTVNWLHDYWYDSGFDEAAGNAQLSNYGRGGEEGDPMRVEVHDNFLGGARNNANMSTPADGLRPRMQLFTFTGTQVATLTFTPGGDVTPGTAAFGPANFDLTALISLANDGVAPATDACQPLSGVTGRIVLADRGTCTFVLKTQNAQAAGAVGIIIANNVAGPAPGLGGADPTIVIAVLSISQADGTALKASLAAGPVTAHMFKHVGVELDSALDNTIISHEWGHYLHHRLADCGLKQCGAMSEGWGDFIALHTIARDGDNLNGVFPLATYSTSGDGPSTAYFGIRRAPYSVDFTKNALTFKHITDGVPLPAIAILNFGANSEVHNAGEVWTSMLWEGYVALQKSRGAGQTFDDVRRRMADYVVDGLKITPANATYTEQRDAILAAAAAAGSDDHGKGKNRNPAAGDLLTLASAFARRGAGTCAVSPERTSNTFAGVVESFDVKARIAIGEVRIEEDHGSCDHDGFIDAGEKGRIVVPVMNGGAIDMLDTTISISSPTSGLSIKKPAVHVARVAPFSSVEVEFEVELDRNFTGIGQLQVNVDVSNGATCEPTASTSAFAWINVDDSPNSSSVDTVESASTPWTATGVNAADIWSRVEVAPLNRAWFGVDFPAVSDTALESPALQVGTTAFVITFDHRFGFETDGGVAPFFDGGVIELSVNGGPWQDISTFVNPGYGGTLFVGSDNPLGGRQAFVGRNASFPARDTVSLNLGTAFAGQSVRIRFRIATDAAASDIGWELDNIGFQGITNRPFSSLIEDLSKCRGVPKKK
jgi:fungalysin metallopeptidase (M36)/PA domain-containing protein/fungalysin/thermolysin propeptide